MDGLEQQIEVLLAELEQEMRQLDLWSRKRPSDRDLASKQPFCYDTLPFNDWLQWVFLPRIREILRQGTPLPAKCDIAPLAEVWLKERGLARESRHLLEIIEELDRCLSTLAVPTAGLH